MTVKLSINLNKIALLRNQRDVGYPDILVAAGVILSAGADGLTVHPRPDERHIRFLDVENIQNFLKSEYANNAPLPEYNIEGYPSDEWLTLVKKHRPNQATLVPDAPNAKTSDNGWNVKENFSFLKSVIADLHAHDIRVSLFMNADDNGADGDNMKYAADSGSDRIELYTGPYSEEFAKGNKEKAITPYIKAAELAKNLGMHINAGHDLSLDNLAFFAKNIAELSEVSIGHAFTSDCLFMGMEKAVKAYKRALTL